MNQTFTSFSDFKRRYPIRPNDVGALLGSGSYGRVFKVEDQVETEWVAIKISEFKGSDTKSLKAEVDLAQRVPRQGNIARYDACYRLETDTSVSDFAIMKYYPDGNLADLLQRVTLTPPQIYDITQGILLGLQHLHRHRIVHRDFKPANILISRDNAGRFIPKIADFGLSRLVTDDELDNSDFDLSDGRGTPSYKAPEQIEGSRVSFNLDLWAFGVILYEMMTGEKPFRADLRNSSEQSARREIEKKIISVELPARMNQVAEPYASMIRRCLVRDIHERVRKEDELLNLLDRIPQLLAEAKRFFTNQQYTEAANLFAQVLDKRENHTEAKEGLALCAEGLRPKPSAYESESTDVYHQGSTDIYVASPPPVTTDKPSSRVVSREPAALKTLVVSVIPPDESRTQSAAKPPTTKQTAKAFAWRVVAPTAIVVSGLVWYFNFRETRTSASSGHQESVEQRAGIGPLDAPETEDSKSVVVIPKPTPKPDETKDALDKRIDIAMGKVRRAYSRGDYKEVVMLIQVAR